MLRCTIEYEDLRGLPVPPSAHPCNLQFHELTRGSEVLYVAGPTQGQKGKVVEFGSVLYGRMFPSTREKRDVCPV